MLRTVSCEYGEKRAARLRPRLARRSESREREGDGGVGKYGSGGEVCGVDRAVALLSDEAAEEEDETEEKDAVVRWPFGRASLSSPRVAMSSTKEGKVVVVAIVVAARTKSKVPTWARTGRYGDPGASPLYITNRCPVALDAHVDRRREGGINLVVVTMHQSEPSTCLWTTVTISQFRPSEQPLQASGLLSGAWQ